MNDPQLFRERTRSVRSRIADYLRREAEDHARAGNRECRWEAAGLTRLATFVEGVPANDERLKVLTEVHSEEGAFKPLTESGNAEVREYARIWPACERIDSACALVVGVGMELSADAWLTRFTHAEADGELVAGSRSV